jgi:MSHA biogenesis protein MshL
MQALTRWCALLAATTAAAATPGVGLFASQRLPDLPVVRLEGAPADGGSARQAQPAVLRPAGIPPLPVTHLDDRLRAADLDAPATLSLTFSSPLPIVDVLLLLFRGTPFSIVPADGAGGTFIGELKNVTLRQALEAVLFPAALDYSVDRTVIRVFPRRMETRLFELDLLNVRRSAQRRVRAGVTLDGTAPAAEITSISESDVFGELGAGVQALLSGSGRYHVDRRAGLVQVTDFAERLDQVGLYLEALQVRASRQVRLHARVFEVRLTGTTAIDWAALAATPGSGVRAAPGVTAGLTVENVDALMTALGALGTIRHIASPQLLAMNQEPAVMRVGAQGVSFAAHEQPPDQERAVSRRGGAVAVAEGLTLTVMAQIAADGIVRMTVSPTFAERTGEARASNGDRVPLLSVAETDTTVRVRDGDTVLVAGLSRERVQVKESTGLAGLFGAQERTVAHAELVVLLTPTVVTLGGGSAAGER